VVVGYSHSHTLAYVGARLAALGRAEPLASTRQRMNGIFYLVDLIVSLWRLVMDKLNCCGADA
jgi:hypothetical protein